MHPKKQDDGRPAAVLTVRIASSSSEMTCFFCGEICSVEGLSECNHLEFVTIDKDSLSDRYIYIFQFRYEGQEIPADRPAIT